MTFVVILGNTVIENSNFYTVTNANDHYYWPSFDCNDEYNFITASMLASEHSLNLLFLTFMQLKYLKKNKNLHNNLNFKKQAQ